jgi:uncharacterized OB-fold protein
MSKKLVATLLTAALVVANCVPALAADTSSDVKGSGVVEYDDSTDVVYDSVTVPTLTAEKYNFEIDPTGLLHEYDADQYEEGSVYFYSLSTRESLVPDEEELESDEKLWKAVKAEVPPVNEKWAGIVKTATVNDETGAITVSALEGGFFVWTPTADDAAGNDKYTSGKQGQWTELDASNFAKWFDVSKNGDDFDLSLKNNYKSGTDICDGKVYQTTYEEIPAAGIVEAAGSAEKVEDYATISAGEVTAYTNVYTKSGEGTEGDPFVYTILAADSPKMVYTAEEATKNGATDSVDVTNKSTKDKVIKATVTLNHADGLTFKTTDAYAENEETTSVYFAATDGTTPVALVASEDGATASATFNVPVAKKTGGADVTYQTSAQNAAGGHVYARYEGANSEYTTKAFYIVASANKDAKAKDNWIKWASKLKADTRPSINIIYDVKDAPSEAEEAVAEFIEAHPIVETAVASITASDLTAINAAIAAFEALDETEDAELIAALAANDPAITAESLAALKAAAEAAAFIAAHPIVETAAADIEADDLSAIEAAIAAFEALDETEDAELIAALAANDPAITAESLAALKAAAEAKETTTGTLTVRKIGTKNYAVVKGEDGADLAEGKLTALTINNVDVLAKATFYQGMYGVLLSDLTEAGVDLTGEVTASYTVDGVKYVATYTTP